MDLQVFPAMGTQARPGHETGIIQGRREVRIDAGNAEQRGEFGLESVEHRKRVPLCRYPAIDVLHQSHCLKGVNQSLLAIPHDVSCLFGSFQDLFEFSAATLRDEVLEGLGSVIVDEGFAFGIREALPRLEPQDLAVVLWLV
jgi:hypothetical protein